jgi:mannose-6-phosphate isomerase-like protein (cupin superfamily)
MEGERHIPFAIQRVYTMYGVAPGYDRGHHAHRTCRQVLVVLAGSVTVVLDDGKKAERLRCDQPHHGILIEPMVWHTLEEFAPGTVCLVLASHRYDEKDYIRDRAVFDAAVKAHRPEGT